MGLLFALHSSCARYGGPRSSLVYSFVISPKWRQLTRTNLPHSRRRSQSAQTFPRTTPRSPHRTGSETSFVVCGVARKESNTIEEETITRSGPPIGESEASFRKPSVCQRPFLDFLRCETIAAPRMGMTVTGCFLASGSVGCRWRLGCYLSFCSLFVSRDKNVPPILLSDGARCLPLLLRTAEMFSRVQQRIPRMPGYWVVVRLRIQCVCVGSYLRRNGTCCHRASPGTRLPVFV